MVAMRAFRTRPASAHLEPARYFRNGTKYNEARSFPPLCRVGKKRPFTGPVLTPNSSVQSLYGSRRSDECAIESLAAAFAGRCRYAWVPVTSTLSHRHGLRVEFRRAACRAAMASGPWSICGSGVGRSKASGMPWCRRCSTFELAAEWKHKIDNTTARYEDRTVLRRCVKRLVDAISPTSIIANSTHGVPARLM